MKKFKKEPEAWDAMVATITPEQMDALRPIIKAVMPVVKVSVRAILSVLTDEQKAMIIDDE